jgi:protein SCO1/2
MFGEVMFEIVKRHCVGITVSVLLLFSGFLLGLFVFQHWQIAQSRNLLSGTVLTSARKLPNFDMQGIDNKPFTPSQLKGQWTWIFFGFTQCPSLCPTTMTKLAKSYQKLKQAGVQNLPRVVMITLDPKRDTLSKLKAYVQAFEPDFYGASGQASVVKNLAAKLGIAYAKVQSPELKQAYTIEHSGAVMVVNPDGKLQAFFNPPFTVKQLVHDHQIFIRKS